MNKPTSLRAHLLASVPELKNNPDRLLIFIDKGTLRCTAAPTLSWEYTYTLQVILTDYPGHPDTVMLPLLGWVSVHQSELLENLEKAKEGIGFEADVLDANKVDLLFSLPLTERVVVGEDASGQTTITHPGEPPPIEAILDPAWQNPLAGKWYVPNG
jgi:hypothetical protein